MLAGMFDLTLPRDGAIGYKPKDANYIAQIFHSPLLLYIPR